MPNETPPQRKTSGQTSQELKAHGSSRHPTSETSTQNNIVRIEPICSAMRPRNT
ncbi:hypothetical protein D9M72_597920 [compost metagenome]